jgi:hypothetical protein
MFPMGESMKLFLNAVLFLAALLLAVSPAYARVRIGIGFNAGFPGYYPYGDYGYPGYGYPYGYPYYGAPPVVYAPPIYAAPPPPTVVYVPQPTVVYQPAPSVNANQTSPSFVDEYGRTCRSYQATTSTAGPAPPRGVACQDSDGAWRIVR